MSKRLIDIYVEEQGKNTVSVGCEVHWNRSYDLYVLALKGILKALEKADRDALGDAVEQIIEESCEDCGKCDDND